MTGTHLTEQQLTEQQLTDIEQRANAATPGPWEEHTDYGPRFYAYLGGSHLRGVGTLNFGDGEDAEADREFVLHAREDVPALLDEVRRLRAELRIGAPWTCPVCSKENNRDVCVICETDRPDTAVEEQPAAEACAKCKTPFDPADTRFDGTARYSDTPYCGRCIDRCHESTDAFHRCVTCQ